MRKVTAPLLVEDKDGKWSIGETITCIATGEWANGIKTWSTLDDYEKFESGEYEYGWSMSIYSLMKIQGKMYFVYEGK